MKTLLLAFVSCGVIGLAIWTIGAPGMPRNSLSALLVIFVFVLPPMGSFWMLYAVIRREKHLLPMVAVACVPYAFVWYYFKRVRSE